MTRTKLADRILPNYTKKEELFNEISHIVGGGLSVVFLVLCIIFSAIHQNAVAVVSSIIYGVFNILLYTMSSIYHGLPKGKAKKVFQVLDHCTIYIMIAGTYTPICLVSLMKVSPSIAWIIFALEWAVTALAVCLTAIDLKKYRVFSMICNLVLGWAIIFVYPTLIEAVGLNGFLLILSGGIAYTVGAILYGIGKSKSYMHCVFHIFVIIGSVLHFFAIFFYVI